MGSLWASFLVDYMKSQSFAAIIEADRMFLKAIPDVALLLGLQNGD